MRAQSKRMWIIGLGTLVAVLLLVLIIVLVTGGDDDASSSPGVSIENLRAVGYDAVLDFSVGGHDDPSEISIDWGDSSSPLTLRGSGALSASHSYPAEPIERLVVVSVTTSDGTVLRTSRTLVPGGAGELSAGTSTTDGPGGSVTTEDPDGSTTTTSPGGTTTTSSTTTSTTTPARPTIEVVLVPRDATFSQEGTGEGSARIDGRTVSVSARTAGLNPESVRTATLTWTMPASRFDGLTGEYQLLVLLEPAWSVKLRTGPNPGRAASFVVDLTAWTTTIDLGKSSDVRGISANDEQQFQGSDALGFGTTIFGEQIGDIVVRIEITCQALPGSNIFQIGEHSECNAADDGGFTVDFARLLLAPVD